MMMRAEGNEGRLHVNICGAIAYVAFLFVYICAFLVSKWITDLQHRGNNNNNNVETTSSDHDKQPHESATNNFMFLFHLIGLILLIVPAVFYVVVGLRENLRNKKVFPVVEAYDDTPA